MEGPAAAAAVAGQAEPADAQQAADPDPGPKMEPTEAEQQQQAGEEPAAPPAPGASLRSAAPHKRKPGRPALHQGCQVRCVACGWGSREAHTKRGPFAPALPQR